MSDDQSPSNEEPVENDVAGLRKVLKELGEDRAKLQQENAALKRNEAFNAAGVPRGDAGSVWDLFRNSYDGDLTPEAISEGVARLGIPEPQATPSAPAPEAPQASEQTDPGVPANEQAAMQDMANVRTQFSPPATDDDPLIQALLSAENPDQIEKIAQQHGFLAPYD